MGNALEVSTMLENRERESRKVRRWISKLKHNEIQIIEKYTEDKAKEYANDCIFSELANFRIAMMASIYLKFGDSITTNDMQEMLILANSLHYENDYFKNFGRNWIMKIDEAKDLMKEEMKKIWKNENVRSQNKMLHAIKLDNRFCQIANKDIVVVFKEVKDEMSGISIDTLEKSQEKVNKALDYIFSDEVDSINKEAVQKNIEQEPKEEVYVQKDIKLKDSIQEVEGEKVMTKVSENLSPKFLDFDNEENELKKEISELESKRQVVRLKKERLKEAIKILESIGM